MSHFTLVRPSFELKMQCMCNPELFSRRTMLRSVHNHLMVSLLHRLLDHESVLRKVQSKARQSLGKWEE